MTLSAASVCSKVNEQITNFFISAALEIAAEMKKLVICSFTLEHTDAALNSIQYAYLC